MTSGNISEEPIAYLDHDAQVRLSPLADGFLTHNRDIHVRVDDSVMRVAGQTAVFIRRSRGFAPDPILLPFDVPSILSVGAELKNHFTLTRDAYAFHSHYIGDLENYETLQSFEEGIIHFENLFRVKPEIIVCDLHPDYLSTRYAMERSRSENLPLVQVQHHHAHLAACLVENSWESDDPVIGLTFDGTGLGTDGTIWGGEVLVGGYTTFNRRFHLNEFLLPGGDRAVHYPARTALALLAQYGIEWDHSLPPVKFFAEKEIEIIHAQIKKKINSPATTSMGRLFDAVASLLGVRQQVNYEGQAAIEMENLCDPNENGMYPFSLSADMIETSETFHKIMTDIKTNISKPIIAAKFHNSIVQMCIQISEVIQLETGLNTVALSGGVWQNMFIYSRTVEKLMKKGFQVLVHKKIPTNDACISLGQSIVAARIRQ
jgi:hydrogenase maturation protein HypF